MNTCDDRSAGDLDCHSRPGTALVPGAHVVSPRTGHSHHGVYVGGGQVVHYRGFERACASGQLRSLRSSSLRVVVHCKF